MKVLAVSTWYPTPHNEVMGVFVRKDTQLLSAEHDVELLHLAPSAAYRSAPVEQVDGTVRVHRIELDLRRPDHQLRARREILRRAQGADLLHTMAFSSLLPLVGARPGIPWVHTEHWSALSNPESVGQAAPAVPLLGRALAGPDVVVPVCDYLARPIRTWRSGPVHVVPCLVDEPAHPTARPEPGPVLRLSAVGALVDRKDPLTAVGAVAELARRGVTAHLTWAGGGPLHDTVLSRAAELGVGDQVTLLGPQMPEQVVEVLAASDVFVLPTLAENFCVSAAEAIRSGRPAVVGDSGGQDEYVDATNGALVSTQTPVAYADAIQQVWERLNGADADDIAREVRRRFSAPAVAEGYREAYRIAVGEHAARGARDLRPLSKIVAPQPFSRRRSEVSGAHGPGASAEDGTCPRVDIVVATHRADRPVERAVRSVLDGTPDVVRALVVAHGLDTAVVEERLAGLPEALRTRVRVMPFEDGIASPAGPMNAGLDASDAEYVGFLGSDDWYEPGAVEAFVRRAERTGADAVIARVMSQGGRLVRTPPHRPRRTGDLDLVQDLLAYRTAPLGILRRSALERLGVRLTSGVPVGEDLEPGLRMWAGGRVEYAVDAPSYVMGEDAVVRTTEAPRPVAAELEASIRLVDGEWFTGLPTEERLAVVVKVVRIHVFGLVHQRRAVARWAASDRADLARLTEHLFTAAPEARHYLSVAEERLVEACLDPQITDRALIERSEARTRHGRPDTLRTVDPRYIFAVHSPLRLMAASALMR